jgi:hypothetical protein
MPKSKAQQALDYVRQTAPKCDTATDLHNAFWGIGGRLGQLFTTREAREQFMRTPEYAQIVKIWESLPWYWDESKAASKPRKKRPATKR